MRLYFLRHATAEEAAANDAARRLTPTGRAEAKIAGAALAALGVEPTRLISSPLLRAVQTAEIVARELKFKGTVEEHDALRNNVPTHELLEALGPGMTDDAFLLVGHMPSLAEHVAALIGSRNPDGLPLDKGGVACVETEKLREDKGELRWLMRQKQLRLIAGR